MDANGNWIIISFTKFISMGSTLQAELWAIFLGFNLAASINIPNMEVETDSIMALQLIKD